MRLARASLLRHRAEVLYDVALFAEPLDVKVVLRCVSTVMVRLSLRRAAPLARLTLQAPALDRVRDRLVSLDRVRAPRPPPSHRHCSALARAVGLRHRSPNLPAFRGPMPRSAALAAPGLEPTAGLARVRVEELARVRFHLAALGARPLWGARRGAHFGHGARAGHSASLCRGGTGTCAAYGLDAPVVPPVWREVRLGLLDVARRALGRRLRVPQNSLRHSSHF